MRKLLSVMKTKYLLSVLSLSMLLMGGCVASVGPEYGGYYPPARPYYYGRPYYAPRPVIVAQPYYRSVYRGSYGGGRGGDGGYQGGGNRRGSYGGGHSRSR